MKRLLLVPLIYLISLSALAQKVAIEVLRTKNSGVTVWQILDNQNNIVFAGNEYPQNDSVFFSLDANNYYFLKISVTSINHADSSLYSLNLNGEPVLYIRSDIGEGDHLFPFFTGIKKTITAKITGGTSTIISEFPWQIYYISDNEQCGGSIIDKKWVITAAHCTQYESGGAIPASKMYIRVGVNNPSNPSEGKKYFVSKVIVHENYNSGTMKNDIALLQMADSINYTNATPIKFVDSTDVAEGALVPGVMSWVTGWGYTHVSPNVVPTSLQKVQLPIVSNEQAATVWNSSTFIIPSTDLMAGYLNGGKDACNGDSGGPLVVPVLGEYKLAGIVSWGSPNCNTYGGYTRVSDFETWIRTKTGIVRNFKPPAPVGDAIICQGTESSQYSVPPIAGALNYEWKILPSSAGVISGSSTNASVMWDISYTGSTTIALRVTINNKVSDWSSLDGNVVPETQLIKQSGDTTICAGQPIILSVNAAGYALTYKWFKNGLLVQSGLSDKLDLSIAKTDDSGDYKCEITGYCNIIVSDNIKLTVYPLTKITHISPDTEVSFGNDITLEVNSDGHDLVYQWQKNGVVIDNSNTTRLLLPNVNATDIGIYLSTVTGTCGIETSDSIYVYVKKPNYSVEPDIFLWPSVTDDEFKVAISNDVFYNIQIFDSMGRKIRELTNCRYQTTINIGNTANGVYIVEIYGSNFRKSVKVIKN
jgi:hypothetical protein